MEKKVYNFCIYKCTINLQKVKVDLGNYFSAHSPSPYSKGCNYSLYYYQKVKQGRLGHDGDDGAPGEPGPQGPPGFRVGFIYLFFGMLHSLCIRIIGWPRSTWR